MAVISSGTGVVGYIFRHEIRGNHDRRNEFKLVDWIFLESCIFIYKRERKKTRD